MLQMYSPWVLALSDSNFGVTCKHGQQYNHRDFSRLRAVNLIRFEGGMCRFVDGAVWWVVGAEGKFEVDVSEWKEKRGG